ncbi:sarcosine oxidase subunit gamma [Marinomonas algarum]|uniref:Sarcosine oxidase subunit gamma family protein n=1 Tax=Marinomonas algarum TaxID=2883105 RepID=A0A9X1IMI8_9GAMM|nr:sarcosine oxidase subunit gamma family protein [Marinomonas algarum]MCB5160493.1 sarcosine oxidase subunit gamma family protein [Marinomonas algarum]
MSEMNNMTAAESAATKAAVMNQVPGPDVEGQSPLHHADFAGLAKRGMQEGGIHLRELALLGHLTLRCDSSNHEQVACVAAILGVSLPLTPLTSAEKGAYSIRWMSPDEWLILVPGLEAFSIESQFRDAMPGHYSLVNSSGGSTVLMLSGDNAVELLKKSTTVDWHLSEFPVGKVVSTLFAKSTATIRRTGDQCFELVIRRSFADYIWLWIQDASLEYGLVIKA